MGSGLLAEACACNLFLRRNSLCANLRISQCELKFHLAPYGRLIPESQVWFSGGIGIRRHVIAEIAAGF